MAEAAAALKDVGSIYRAGGADHRRIARIGRAIAVRLAACGATVAGVARTLDGLEATLQAIREAGEPPKVWPPMSPVRPTSTAWWKKSRRNSARSMSWSIMRVLRATA